MYIYIYVYTYLHMYILKQRERGDSFSIKFELKMKGNCSEAAQSRFSLIFNWILIRSQRKLLWGTQSKFCLVFNLISIENQRKLLWGSQSRFCLIFNWILIENQRKLLWVSPEQILLDFQLNSNWKLKETALRQPRADYSQEEVQKYKILSHRRLLSMPSHYFWRVYHTFYIFHCSCSECP